MTKCRGTEQMRYEFVVDGELTERALAAFPEFTVGPSRRAVTTLCGPVAGGTQLRGILGQIRHARPRRRRNASTPGLTALHP